MSKHTPGPWQINSNDACQVCDSDGVRRGCAPIAHCPGTEARANARRIVACVNACEGLDTEFLENGGLITGVGACVDDYNELLEALTKCQEQLRKLTFTDYGITSALESAASAIAKAEGN